MWNKLFTPALFLFALGIAAAHAQPAPPAPTAPTAGGTAAKKAPPAKRSIVLVHGSWADGSSWDRVVPLLRAKGYKVVSVHLPLTGPADDVAAVQRAIAEQPGDVTLVGHSYGGFVISEAGNDAKVKNLVYVDAFGLDAGETANSLFKDKPPAWLKTLKIDGGGFAWLPEATVMNVFAYELPEAERQLILAKQGPIPVKSFDEAAKNPAWKTKPSWYVHGKADRIIPPDAQASMAKRMKATVTSIDAGHLPMLSKPNDVARVILTAATAPMAQARR